MNRSILKIGILLLAACLTASLVFSYFRIARERETLLDDLNRRARVIAKSLAPPSIRFLRNPPKEEENDLAERLSGQGRTMGILLCNPEGKVIARSIALAEIKDCEEIARNESLAEGNEQILFQEEKGLTLHSFTHPLKDRSGAFLGTLTVVHEASYINERVRSLITWTTLTVAILALFISAITYFLSRRSFQRSIDKLLGWMKSERETAMLPPSTESLLKPAAREVEKLTARLRSARETAREVSEEKQVTNLWTAARLKAHAVTLIGNKKLIVVSNREPYMHVKEHGRSKVLIPASGLVTSLDPILRATSGLWIAHGAGDGDWDVVDPEGKVLVPPDSPSYTLKRIPLSKEEEEGYYYGFSNEAMWPLCHLTHHRPLFEEKDWISYKQVNRKFAEEIIEECGRDHPFILVQDYHFTLLPRFIKERRPDAVVGLFWHIPWPNPEVFQVCPWKREIKDHHDPQTVYTFLRMAAACIVSSLADGMNLVAKEFVAAREGLDGVLILSEFAGAAREFQEALPINPHARTDFAEAIRIALKMSAEEQRRRMARLKAQVAENNVYRWAADLLSELAQAAQTIPQKESPLNASSGRLG